MVEEKELIKFPDWERLDIRVGKIVKAEPVEGADKLYKLTVNLGDEIGERTICAGLKEYLGKEDLEGKKSIFLVNLEPRALRGIESQGMILAAGSKEDGTFALLEPSKDLPEGTLVS